MQKAVAEGTRGEVGEFCVQLCVRRMGDEVREVGRVGGGAGYGVKYESREEITYRERGEDRWGAP